MKPRNVIDSAPPTYTAFPRMHVSRSVCFNIKYLERGLGSRIAAFLIECNDDKPRVQRNDQPAAYFHLFFPSPLEMARGGVARANLTRDKEIRRRKFRIGSLAELVVTEIPMNNL